MTDGLQSKKHKISKSDEIIFYKVILKNTLWWFAKHSKFLPKRQKIIDRYFNDMQIQTFLNRKSLKSLSLILTKNNIDVIVIKGGSLILKGIYKEMERFFIDIDIIVRYKDVMTLHNLLVKQGYTSLNLLPESLFKDKESINKAISGLYQKKKTKEDNTLVNRHGKYINQFGDFVNELTNIKNILYNDYHLTYINSSGAMIEVHFSLFENDLPFNIRIDDLFKNSLKTKIPNVYSCPAEFDIIIFATHLFHSNFAKPFKHLLDLQKIVHYTKQSGDQIDWNKIVKYSVMWKVSSYVYYFLKNGNELFSLGVPKKTLIALRKNSPKLHLIFFQFMNIYKKIVKSKEIPLFFACYFKRGYLRDVVFSIHSLFDRNE